MNNSWCDREFKQIQGSKLGSNGIYSLYTRFYKQPSINNMRLRFTKNKETLTLGHNGWRQGDYFNLEVT